MLRADNVGTARNTLLIDAAALMGALGVAVLTVSTIIGAVTAAGTVGVLATRMVNTSKGGHNDITRAYELIGLIQSVR